jgi:hypothetical protein
MVMTWARSTTWKAQDQYARARDAFKIAHRDSGFAEHSSANVVDVF